MKWIVSLLFAAFASSVISAQTTTYYLVVPPNDIQQKPFVNLSVALGADANTVVSITDNASGQTFKRAVKADELLMISEANGELQSTSELRLSDHISKNSIKLTAEEPFSAVLLNSKSFSSDAYLARPVEKWGTHHVVASYYDFNENAAWAGGFAIVSASNNNTVAIKLRGEGAIEGTASGGKRIGEEYTITLQQGEVYNLYGNGTTRGTFDLSGTEIMSSNPVGVVGYHQRTTMPNTLADGNGRSHLAEWLLPVNNWGKEYITTNARRDGTGGIGRGDVFRVICSASSTRWTMKSYDKTSGELLAQAGGVLHKPGDIVTLSQVVSPTELPNGVTVWSADKPIQIIQYTPSQSFDDSRQADPWMLNVVSAESYRPQLSFTVPQLNNQGNAFIQVIAKTNPSDPDYASNLASIKLNGASVPVQFVTNDIHLLSLPIAANGFVQELQSNGTVQFGGFIEWTAFVDSYAFPIESFDAGTGVISSIEDQRSTDASVTVSNLNGQLSVSAQSAVVSVEVVSIDGSTVLSLAGNGTRHFDGNIKALANGAYIVRVLTESGVAAHKIIR